MIASGFARQLAAAQEQASTVGSNSRLTTECITFITESRNGRYKAVWKAGDPPLMRQPQTIGKYNKEGERIMAETKTMTADERKDTKELATLFKVLKPDERQVVLNIGHDLVMIRNMGYECRRVTGN